MDWLTFIAALVDHLAWPVAATILLVAFRKPIAERIRAIRRVKYQDLELDLTEELQELGDKVRQTNVLPPPPAQPRLPPGSTQYRALLDEAKGAIGASPAGAILLGWAALEQALNDTTMRLKVSPDPPSRLNAKVSTEFLQQAKQLTDKTVQVIQGLQRIRNTVAHPRQEGEVRVSAENAEKYLGIVGRLIDGLDSKMG